MNFLKKYELWALRVFAVVAVIAVVVLVMDLSIMKSDARFYSGMADTNAQEASSLRRSLAETRETLNFVSQSSGDTYDIMSRALNEAEAKVYRLTQDASKKETVEQDYDQQDRSMQSTTIVQTYEGSDEQRKPVMTYTSWYALGVADDMPVNSVDELAVGMQACKVGIALEGSRVDITILDLMDLADGKVHVARRYVEQGTLTYDEEVMFLDMLGIYDVNDMSRLYVGTCDELGVPQIDGF